MARDCRAVRAADRQACSYNNKINFHFLDHRGNARSTAGHSFTVALYTVISPNPLIQIMSMTEKKTIVRKPMHHAAVATPTTFIQSMVLALGDNNLSIYHACCTPLHQ